MESKIWHKWTYLLNRNRFKRLFDSHQHIFIEVKLTYNIVLISTVEWLSYTFCCCCCLVAQSCPILCNPTDCSPPGSSVHGILQARILEWVTIPFSRGSSWLRDQTWVSCIADRFFTTVPPGKPRSWVDKSKCQQYRLVFLLLLFWVFHHWTWATAKGQLLPDAIRPSVSTCSDSEINDRERSYLWKYQCPSWGIWPGISAARWVSVGYSLFLTSPSLSTIKQLTG